MAIVGMGLILTSLTIFFLIILLGEDDNDNDPY
jgi:hypothetical protein